MIIQHVYALSEMVAMTARQTISSHAASIRYLYSNNAKRASLTVGSYNNSVSLSVCKMRVPIHLA